MRLFTLFTLAVLLTVAAIPAFAGPNSTVPVNWDGHHKQIAVDGTGTSLDVQAVVAGDLRPKMQRLQKQVAALEAQKAKPTKTGSASGMTKAQLKEFSKLKTDVGNLQNAVGKDSNSGMQKQVSDLETESMHLRADVGARADQWGHEFKGGLGGRVQDLEGNVKTLQTGHRSHSIWLWILTLAALLLLFGHLQNRRRVTAAEATVASAKEIFSKEAKTDDTPPPPAAEPEVKEEPVFPPPPPGDLGIELEPPAAPAWPAPGTPPNGGEDETTLPPDEGGTRPETLGVEEVRVVALPEEEAPAEPAAEVAPEPEAPVEPERGPGTAFAGTPSGSVPDGPPPVE
jgi:hypothetical protein